MLALLMLLTGAQAHGAMNWDQLTGAARAQKVEILLTDGKRLSGDNLAVTDTSYSVSGGTAERNRVKAIRVMGPHRARIRRSDGSELEAQLFEVRPDNSLVLRKDAADTITVPRASIAAISFGGSHGRSSLWGTLIGVGGAVAIVSAFAGSEFDYDSERAFRTVPVAAAILVPSGAVAGYFIGRAFRKPAFSEVTVGN